MIDVNRLPLEGEGGLIQLLAKVVDPRKARGVRYPIQTVLAIAICATLSGALSFCAIAEWAQSLSPELLRRLCSKRREPPSEPTIRRILHSIDTEKLDAQIGNWILEQTSLAGKAISIDGKTLRGAHDRDQRPPHLLSAILHEEALVVGQVAVDQKTNAIPKLRELAQDLPIEGAVITADAMHTQKETARFLVEDKAADFIFIAKDNQPTLKQYIEDLHLNDFPPSAQSH